jgi:hypothetical protein
VLGDRARKTSTLPPTWRTRWPRATTSDAISPKQWTPSNLRSSAQKISFSRPTITGDGPARSGGQVAPADDVWDAGGAHLLLRGAHASDLRYAVDRAARGLVGDQAKHQPARVGRRDTPLLHSSRGERRRCCLKSSCYPGGESVASELRLLSRGRRSHSGVGMWATPQPLSKLCASRASCPRLFAQGHLD